MFAWFFFSFEAKKKNSVRLDPRFSGVVERASLGLGLAQHHVVDGRGRKGEACVSSCVDLEGSSRERNLMWKFLNQTGHLGKDGRFYLLDFSRAFPCAVKPNREKDRVGCKFVLRKIFLSLFLL